MGPTASTLIALGSLALAALTVLVSYLNVRVQADAAMQLEHVKWLREKRDELYNRILAVLDGKNWNPVPGPDDSRWAELEEVSRLAVRYASDAVLAETQTLAECLRSARLERSPIMPAEEARARTNLVRRIRVELAGEKEAAKTWRRYERHRR
jgi:hypothetical protein